MFGLTKDEMISLVLLPIFVLPFIFIIRQYYYLLIEEDAEDAKRSQAQDNEKEKTK